MSSKRITFSEHDATHLYELALEHFCDREHCYQCMAIRKRLEKFIGPSTVRFVRKAVKKNSYCKHNINNHENK